MERAQPRRALSRGFTLIEVLAALAVLAIALSALIASMARYAGNAGNLREKTYAVIVAHNRLAQIQLAPVWPDVGNSDGEMELAGVEWRWKAEVQKTADEHLRRVDVEVRRKDADKDEEDNSLASLSAFIADTGRQ